MFAGSSSSNLADDRLRLGLRRQASSVEFGIMFLRHFRSVSLFAVIAASLTASICRGQSFQDDRFPFVISGFDAEESATDFSMLSPTPAGDDGFVRIVDGHFATESGRLKIWGVNLCFGAIFPTHEDADRVAAHLAKIGINGVRIHHHETSASPRGLFTEDGRWDPQQVDRLDYFLAKLHDHGIYANLNLHVGRSVSRQLGMPSLGSEHYLMHDKHALHFQPEIQDAFWRFCREYLGHVNPYRKLRRADDPAIAMIEIANENKFSLAGPGALLNAPEPYRSALMDQWNQWLIQKYGQTGTLRNAWASEGAAPSRVLVDSQAWADGDISPWNLSDNNGKSPIRAVVRMDGDDAVLRLVPQAVAAQGWHQQLTGKTFGVTKDSFYRLTFQARSDQPRSVGMNVAKTIEGEWTPLGLVQGLNVRQDWDDFQFRFQAPQTVDEGVRLSFDLGGEKTAIELKNVRLVQGSGSVSVPQGQSLEKANVDLPKFDWSLQSRRDFRQFMLDLEKRFYNEAKQLLREEIGVRVPITTTQANYQPPEITATIADFADMHAYWHHPIFPGRPWDGSNWTVQNETMVAFPFHNQWPRNNLLMRTAWRMHDKPFTFSEWNAGEPGFFAADAIPAAAMIASLQDWDAVFFFNYHSSNGRWDTDAILGYFDLNGQPTKIALTAAFANLYRRGDLSPLEEPVAVSADNADRGGALAMQYRVGMTVDPDAHRAAAVPSAQDLQRPERKRLATPDGSVRWDARSASSAHVLIDTPKTRCAWGLVGGQAYKIGTWDLQFGETERDYAVLVATSRDDRPLESSSSILLTVVANGENQNMGWNDDRTTVGQDWGHGPTVVNGVPAVLSIPADQTARRLYALDAKGRRVRTISGKSSGTMLRFEIGPQYKTLFYELSE
ncbi:carbohydrate binding domain-containing protein [Crateriforma conspicua]|uniref:carbohydrate binding domain-containing protein n=1 Tax=Crateriforma conspicua TaxID=2527996 RepID=UPI001189D2EE|nr:carbohydrate binding domain-containing protein [Crateriforma conspicua]QDV62078.1 hypothetical protein Mal65_12060 [Crateriforma conspicua]